MSMTMSPPWWLSVLSVDKTRALCGAAAVVWAAVVCHCRNRAVVIGVNTAGTAGGNTGSSGESE